MVRAGFFPASLAGRQGPRRQGGCRGNGSILGWGDFRRSPMTYKPFHLFNAPSYRAVTPPLQWQCPWQPNPSFANQEPKCKRRGRDFIQSHPSKIWSKIQILIFQTAASSSALSTRAHLCPVDLLLTNWTSYLPSSYMPPFPACKLSPEADAPYGLW